MKVVLNLQTLSANEEVNLHGGSYQSVSCKDSSNASWFAC